MCANLDVRFLSLLISGNNCNTWDGNSASEMSFAWFSFALSFAIPFTAVLIMNVLIIVGFRRQAKKMSNMMREPSTSMTDVSSVSDGAVRHFSRFL